MTKKKRRLWMVELVAIVLGILYIVPLVLVVINSFKTNPETIMNFFSFLPSGIHTENYVEAWEKMKYPKAFSNTLILTVGATVGSVVFGSMASYKMCRTKTWYSNLMFLICISPLMITFSSVMITLSKVAKNLHLINSIWGLIIIYWGLLLPFTIFLYHGNIKAIPLELEEAAMIDGCGSVRTFVAIVFPLLKPITTTVFILNGIKIWNDFLTPLIMIGSRSATHTLVLAANQFSGTYHSNYALSMAAFCMTSIPIVVFYLFMQKHIVKGITAGSVKS